MLRLVTIPISHYCEKARWALGRAGISYREERHVQGIHRMASRRAGGHGTVPVLVTPEAVLGESEEILEWVDGRVEPELRLHPSDPGEREGVERLCRRLDGDFGVRGRRLMYSHMLGQRRVMLDCNNQGVPRWEDAFMRAAWPLMTRVAGRVLGLRPGVEVEDEAVVVGELDFVAELLSDGRPHLCGERFTAADLTFAALAAAVVAPPNYGVRLPQPGDVAPETAAVVERMRAHPAGAYALSLYEARAAGAA